jgi:hypothetical protein
VRARTRASSSASEKRLGHVVVGAQIQPLDPLLDAVGRGEDQHRQAAAAAAQLAQHLEAVHARQPQVQDHQVELVGRQCSVGFGAGADLVDGIARGAQGTQQAIGQDLVIFRDEDAHALVSSGPLAVGWARALILGRPPWQVEARLHAHGAFTHHRVTPRGYPKRTVRISSLCAIMTPSQEKAMDAPVKALNTEKAKALQAALAQIEKQFGKGSIMRLGEGEVIEDIQVVSTGSLGLDIALGVGGLPRGRVVEIYGPNRPARPR